MRYILSENLPNIDKIKDDKMTELRQIFQKLFHKDHPIAKNLFFLDNVEVIRIITQPQLDRTPIIGDKLRL
jgi:hypothetical protein